MSKLLIVSQTDPAVSPWFGIPEGEQVSLQSIGLSGVEEIDIEFTPDKGVTTGPAKQGGDATLSVDYTIRIISGPGVFRLSKPLTALPTGCWKSSNASL